MDTNPNGDEFLKGCEVRKCYFFSRTLVRNDTLWRNNPETYDLTPTFPYCPLISWFLHSSKSRHLTKHSTFNCVF